MKSFIALLVTVCLTTIQLFAQAPKHVDAKTFFNQIQLNEGIILDVRTSGEYSRGHIEGSTLISVADKKVTDKLNMLQKDKAIYVYCLTGSRSRSVVNYMSQNGFSNVYNLQRGIVEWHQMGYPIVQSKVVAQSQNKTYSATDFNSLLNSNELVLIDFHAPWCAPCKKMAPSIEKLKADYKGKALVEKVDVEVNKSLQTSYKVQSIPGLVLFKNGKEIWRYTGILTYNELAATLNKHL